MQALSVQHQECEATLRGTECVLSERIAQCDAAHAALAERDAQSQQQCVAIAGLEQQVATAVQRMDEMSMEHTEAVQHLANERAHLNEQLNATRASLAALQADALQLQVQLEAVQALLSEARARASAMEAQHACEASAAK